MTEKQKIFCDEYLIDLNATRAYKAAYPNVRKDESARKAGSRLLTFVDIRAYIDQRMAEKQSSLIADQDEILRYLTSVIRGESVSQEIVIESTGGGYTEARLIDKTPSEKDKLKAAELVGKRYGLYNEKVDVNVHTPVVIMGYDDIED